MDRSEAWVRCLIATIQTRPSCVWVMAAIFLTASPTKTGKANAGSIVTLATRPLGGIEVFQSLSAALHSCPKG